MWCIWGIFHGIFVFDEQIRISEIKLTLFIKHKQLILFKKSEFVHQKQILREKRKK